MKRLIRMPGEEKTKKVSKPKSKFDTPVAEIPCLTCKNVPIAPHGNPGGYMFVGAYPGWQEEKQGKFFVGDSGTWFMNELRANGINPDTECWFTNVFKCRFVEKGSWKQRPVTKADYKKCAGQILNEIMEVKPKLIILMGEVATTMFLAKSRITQIRGTFFEKGSFKLFATFNPAHLIREKDKLTSNDVFLFRRDLKVIYNFFHDAKNEVVTENKTKRLAKTNEDVIAILNELNEVGKFSLDIETYSPEKIIIINDKKKSLKTALDPWSEGFQIHLISFSYKRNGFRHAFAIPLEHPESTLTLDFTLKELEYFFNRGIYKISGQHVKFDIKCLKVHFGIDVKDIAFDTLTAHSLLVGAGVPHNLERMSSDYLLTEQYKYVLGEKGKKGSTVVELEKLADMSMEDCINTTELAEIFEEQLKRDRQLDYYNKFIVPGVPTLMRMEARGMLVDQTYLSELESSVKHDLTELKDRLYSYPEISGHDYKITSNQHLQRILFDHFKFPKGRKTKTGFAVDKDVVENLYTQTKHPFLKDLLDFRQLEKMYNTYVLPYTLHYVKKDGRVHGQLNQHVTLTGRLSMENPNLQNLPVKIGALIMSMFVPPNGWKIMMADYNQIELRIMAVAANDRRMLDAFKSGVDIHKATASDAYGVPIDQVTKEQRQDAKVLNFGIIYGMSAMGLAENLGIPQEAAQARLDAYLDNYHGIKEHMKKCIADYQQYGYVENLFGRRIYIKSKDKNHNERVAVNGPIQGTASDICARSSHIIDRMLLEEGLESGMIDTIHDSLVFELAPLEEKALPEIVKTMMETVDISFMRNYALMKEIGLKVDVSLGNNLSEAK